ncbi:MAG: pyrrolo-quinoline quinone [Sneathiella sp.]|uniref:outer membrane protein assembly factor BamB family protein n=1 Tax=Sneathiella sp. TaxID=1964365 RepID=UPI000C40974C|nr:PQQ-binding-like beta-propeller repeat protein [Sneathiella sp.]MAZ04601.1 pyrrolo-quinoline quinone [Sneathiella sp.]
MPRRLMPTVIRPLLRPALMGAALLGLGACSWFGNPEAPPLPGDRISILSLEQTLEADAGLADLQVRLPAPYENANWPQAGGVPSHALYHLELGDELEEAWRVSIGDGSDDENRMFSSPVIVGGKVYAMDSSAEVTAYSAEDGKELWSVNLTPEDEDEGNIGGGLSFEYGRVFATTSYGDIVALDGESGETVWKTGLGVPLRAAPTIADGQIFVITFDSRIFALDAATGDINWNFEGGIETTGLLGAASPAYDNGTVVVPFASGELYAFRAANGQQAWSDQLVRRRLYSSLTSLTDINAFPVIDRGVVYAASYSGRMIAVDLRTGNRLWDQEISTLQTPWVAGDFLFVVSTDGDLVCMSRRNGLIRWVRPLGKYEDPEDKRDLIIWTGPILASDRLILVSNYGLAVSVSPYDGKVLGRMELSDPASIPPVVAGNTLYILTDDADLVALRAPGAE